MYSLEPEVIYKATHKDQGKALDEACAYGVKQGWELRSVIWEKEDEEGNHHFKISFNKPAATNPHAPPLNSNVKADE
jgi:hypothetical protein